jgi:outer membrane protein
MRFPTAPAFFLPVIRVFFLILCATPAVSAQEEPVSLFEAVMKTLRSHPGVSIQEEHVEQREGELQSASGQFDWVGLSSISKDEKRYHFTQNQEEATQIANLLGPKRFSDSWRKETTAYSVGARRATRSGVVVLPSLSTLDVTDLTSDLESENRAEMGVEILIPLLRGLGEESTGALETAARSALTTTEWESKHNISGQILETAAAYWGSLAAQETYQVLLDTGKRADDLNRLVELLVKGGEAEPATLHQARAKLLQRKADIRVAEQNYYDSRQRLARALGYSPQEMTTPPQPEGPFPPVVVPDVLDKDREERYVAQALSQRADYLAAQNNITTQEILFRKSELDKKPRLDFDFATGITGLSERENATRFWRSLSNDRAGPGVFVGLNLEWPIANNTAIGEFIKRRSLLREARLSSSLLSNTIASDVLAAMEKLRSSAQEHRLFGESAEAYREAVKFEDKKVRAGESSLNALIDLEDRYYEVRLNQVRAQQKYALALAELRFSTGTLLTEDARNFRFKPNSLLILPLVGEP